MTLRFERMVAGIIVMMVVLVSSPVLAQDGMGAAPA
ncbi:MAG: hypothetical protein CMO02_18515, partial [Thalassospira sp.]|nr:hypothetical protein [Thalassospira sp.]